MEVQYALSTQDFPRAPLSVQIGAAEFARVNADGTCWVDWEACEKASAGWAPHGQVYQALAKLLLHARDAA